MSDFCYWSMDKTAGTYYLYTSNLSTHLELPVAGGEVKAGFHSPADDFLDAREI